MGFPSTAPVISNHPDFQWRNRNRGNPDSRARDFRRSIRHVPMRRAQRHPVTGQLPDDVHQTRVLMEMKETLGYVFFVKKNSKKNFFGCFQT